MSSIFGLGKQKGNTEPTTVASETTTTEITSQPKTIDATSLVVAWRQVVADGTLFDKATMGRLGSMEPVFMDQTHFKFIVANQNVDAFLRTLKDTILRAMRSRLGVSGLDFTIEQMESDGPQKILSPREQATEMEKLNPAFKRLRDALGLEL